MELARDDDTSEDRVALDAGLLDVPEEDGVPGAVGTDPLDTEEISLQLCQICTVGPHTRKSNSYVSVVVVVVLLDRVAEDKPVRESDDSVEVTLAVLRLHIIS